MKIAIAADHAGFRLKEEIKKHCTSQQRHEVIDLGTDSEESCDYSDFAHRLARMIVDKEVERGILICGSGVGMCMTANRYKGVRAAVLHEPFDAEMSRRHNDANVACLGARVTTSNKAVELLDIWFTTPFEGGRHKRRLDTIDNP